MSVSLVVLSVCLFALVAGLAVKKQNLIQATPSLIWFSLMTLPFIFEWRFFPSTPRTSQSIGMFLISTSLALGDIAAIHIKQANKELKEFHDKSNMKFLYFLTALVLIIPILHYFLAGSIPLINQYFGGFNPNQISNSRENFVKLLEVPYILKILFNWVLTIFGPTCILWFYFKKKPFMAGILFIWVLSYASSSSADGQIVIFIWVLVFGFCIGSINQKNFSNRVVVGISLALVLVISSGVLLGNAAVSQMTNCGVRAGSGFTPGDVLRSCTSENEITINPIIDKLGYRIFLTPIEVSNHWYDFFDGSPSEKRKFNDIFERQNSKKASNKVGVWAYTERFPQAYSRTINANASIDADASSLGGILWIFFVALVLFLLRIILCFSHRNEAIHVRIIEGIGLGLLAYLPNSAPLQAILVPQGLIVVIILLLYARRDLWRSFIIH